MPTPEQDKEAQQLNQVLDKFEVYLSAIVASVVNGSGRGAIAQARQELVALLRRLSEENR